MRYTIFNTPVLSPILYGLALFLLKISGWRKEGRLPDIPKYVVTGAYHTSNWDFPLGILFAFAFRANMRWMGKDSLFRWPFHSLFRWMGGIPIDRTNAHGVVAESVRAFNENGRMIMAIAPEGTRRKVDTWKKGFYYIALNARVPILLASLDFGRKVAGIGPLVTPSGDIEADMEIIRDFYANVTARHPERAGVPAVDVRAGKDKAPTHP